MHKQTEESKGKVMKAHKFYIGIDNGTSGTIAILGGEKSHFIKTPKKMEQSYTKKKQNISRIKFEAVLDFFDDYTKPGKRFAVLERPLVNPAAFRTTMSAMRALEATVLILELMHIPYCYIDSKQWQKVMLPLGTKGSPELKKASADIGCRLFPEHSVLIRKHKDADGLLIAEWARRNNL